MVNVRRVHGESVAGIDRARCARGVGAEGTVQRTLGVGPDGAPREYFIWGATAAMLRNLYRFLAG